MKQNWENKMNVRGYVFNTKNLNLRTSKDGSNYISGNVNIATDEDAMSVVSVSFYATEKYKSGKPNGTYNLLKQIIDGEVHTYEQVGKDAVKVRIDANIGVNDFVGKDGEIRSPKQIHGSFMYIDKYPGFEAKFEADAVFTSATERKFEGEEPFLALRGFVLGFKNALIPVEFTARDKASMNFFESQDISPAEPLAINIGGEIVTNTVVRESTEETAFGERTVNNTRSFQSWVVTSGKMPYEFGDDAVMTKDDIKRLTAEREVVLERVKERAANRAGNSFATTSKPATKGVDEYDF